MLLFRFVKQHLVRSRKLPLTAFIRLEGAYNYSLSKVIVALLSSRQGRWKRVGIWFETEAGKDVIPIPKMQLFVEAIMLLEELHVSFSTEYIITSSTGRSLRNALPSLTHLDLHTVCECREAMRWLDLAPNLKELNIKHGPNYTSDYIRHPSYPLLFEPEVVIPKIHMTHLHVINQTERFSPSGDVMLKRMSCPALTELRLDAGIFASHIINNVLHSLCGFLRRGRPNALEFAHLGISGWLLDPNSITEVLSLMPSLRTFSIARRKDNRNNIAFLLDALARAGDPSNPAPEFVLLPALENLQIVSSRVPPLSLVRLIESRHRVHGRSLKRVKLSKCTVGAEGFTEVPFSDFKSLEDLDSLPAEWVRLKTPIEEGLQLVIEN